jgi:Asp-tRNA(Asn)/Glu-tRNA(Gln) amidotransferase A subunit family amidase
VAEDGPVVEPAPLPSWAWPPARSGAIEPGPFPVAGPLSWSTGPTRAPRFAVKENIAVAGRPLRAGSPARGRLPPQPADAPVVTALRQAGFALAGTTRMHELAFGVSGRNDADGTAANPADPNRLPGGSSSGSAVAVATGLVDLALATDTGGSARNPAALCGVVGYKASRAVPTTGVLPLAPSLDHLGWCSRDVETARRVADVLGIARLASSRRLRLGVVRTAWGAAEPDVRTALDRACACLDADLVDLEWPHADEVAAVTSTLIALEAARLYDGTGISPDVVARLTLGASVTAAQEHTARSRGRALVAAWSQATTGLDAVLAPTCSITAPLLGAASDPGVVAALVRTTRLDDLTGLPAVSLPVPTSGLPVGLHVGARTDAELLAVAARIETWLRT